MIRGIIDRLRGLHKGFQLLLGLIIVFLFWLSGQLFGILAQESYVFADIIWKPFRLLGESNPSDIQNKDWVKPAAIGRFILILFVWVTIITFPILMYCFSKYRRKFNSIQKEIEQVRISSTTFLDFENEIKEVVHVMEDTNSSQQQIDGHMKRLFDSVVKYVTDFYGQASHDVRASLFVKHNGDLAFSNFRWGWDSNPRQDGADLYMIGHLLTTDTSHAFWRNIRDQEMFRNGDKNTALLIRNIGKIRLGILFSFRNHIPDIEEKTNELSKAILPFSLLGLTDNIPDNVVRYNQGGGENAI